MICKIALHFIIIQGKRKASFHSLKYFIDVFFHSFIIIQGKRKASFHSLKYFIDVFFHSFFE